MTQHDSPWNSDDEVIRKLLRPVGDMNLPLGLEAKCLAAGREGSLTVGKTQKNQSDDLVPTRVRFPVSMAASLLIGLGAGWLLRGQVAIDITKTSDVSLPTSLEPKPETRFPFLQMPFATSRVEFQEGGVEKSFFTEEVYMCGIGRIQSKSEYRITGESK